MSRDATFDLIARDKSGPGVTSTTRGLERVSDEAKRAQREIDRMQATAERSLRAAAARQGSFGRTGEALGSRLTAGIASGLSGLVGVGGKAGKLLTGGMVSSVSAAGPILGIAILGAGTAAAAAAAPAIGAALAGGIILALTGGVLAAGIAGAMGTDRIDQIINGKKTTAQQEFVDEKGNRTKGETLETRASGGLADTAKRVAATFSGPFIEPLARVLELVNQKLGQWEGTLGRLGAKAAPLIDRLAPALISMAENSFPGIERSLSAAAPVVNALAEGLPGLGVSVSKFFDTIAQSGPGAAIFLRDAIDGLGALIEHTGRWIAFLSAMYIATRNAFLQSEVAILSFVSKALGAYGTLLEAAATAARALGMPQVGARLDEAARKVQGAVDRVNGSLSQIRQQIDVNVNVKLSGIAGARADIANLRGQSRDVALGGTDGWASARSAAAFGAGATFAASGGGSRVGGPTHVEQTLNVTLDGAPFYAMTATAVSESSARDAWRAKVGKR